VFRQFLLHLENALKLTKNVVSKKNYSKIFFPIKIQRRIFFVIAPNSANEAFTIEVCERLSGFSSQSYLVLQLTYLYNLSNSTNNHHFDAS